MIRKLPVLLLLLTIAQYKANACFNNFYALNSEGKLALVEYTWSAPFIKNFNQELNVAKLHKLEEKLKTEKNYMLLSDYAVCLTRLGKQQEALQILTVLYKHYPNDYKIAANLGTAYELTGQNDSALKYIKRDMQLNPNDHEGSEWIHVKVLETKLALQKDPAYLGNYSVLHLSEKQKSDTTVLLQIAIQLQERVPFTPAPNEIMASLFTDLGDVCANTRSIEYASAYYQIAKKYYGSTSDYVNKRIHEMALLMNKYKAIQPPRSTDIEGENEKLGGIYYKQLLLDNNTAYKINWEKINTDVNALLGLVDFSKPASEVKAEAIAHANKATDELTLIPDNKKDNPKTESINRQTSAGRNYTLVYALCFLLALTAGYFIFRSRKL